SVNFITAHDGFTLNDLVSYNSKHNEANGEDNRDGTDNNFSWNCGVEGPTDDAHVRALRETQKRNMLATLLLAQGMPMITAGDEFGRTQDGNNNAYCQDNELGWVHWDRRADTDFALTDFVQKVLRLRREHPVFRRAQFLTGEVLGHRGLKDVAWLAPEGREMETDDWSMPFARCLGMELYRPPTAETGADENHFVLLMNGSDEPISFSLPELHLGGAWRRVFDTARTNDNETKEEYSSRETYSLLGRSCVLLHDT
ncbi:MAG: glycogen debranching enzyme GlgX, partial [Rhodospirillales bacterium]|nr:glycogen debranching enzyme GlgX [Rhodospirillales bacterium]